MASLFGLAVDPAPSVDAASWIRAGLDPGHGVVGALVPAGFDRTVRVDSPGSGSEPPDGPGVEAVRALAALGAAHTTTPERAWFAIWEGHGWLSRTYLVSRPRWRRDPLGAARGALEARRVAARERRERAGLAAALRTVPTFDLPIRRYYLLSGPLSAAPSIADPADRHWGQLPDLWWPDDRAWFVAGDVDLDSTYVAGAAGLAEAVGEHFGDRAEVVSRSDPLR